MTQPNLRIYRPDENSDAARSSHQTGPTQGLKMRIAIDCQREDRGGAVDPVDSKVTVSAGDLFKLLQDAVETNRTWLRDFEDDRVTISQDFYEVLLAYRRLRNKAA